MHLWVVIPVKPIDLGKSRLASVIPSEIQSKFNYDLFVRTVSVLLEVPGILRIQIISRDPIPLSFAKACGVKTIVETTGFDLNKAIKKSIKLALLQGAEAIMVIPTDLPLMDIDEVNHFLSQIKNPPVVALSPDNLYTGTNLLYFSPADLIESSFGVNSFINHCTQSTAKNSSLIIYNSKLFSFDLDTPEDLQILASNKNPSLDLSQIFQEKVDLL